ncbi:MAG: hypothetical protein FWB80_08150 [Defluviitaleaceae bacterium]|nr:hypothetical protein [Defluviitaleaceae bacterium]
MQTFKQPYLCLSAQTYRIDQEENGKKTGEFVEGITIRYVPTDNLAPQEDAQAYERGQVSRGVKAAKMTLPIAAKNQLGLFPAIYNVEMEMAVVGDKLQVKGKAIEFLHEVSLVTKKAS